MSTLSTNTNDYLYLTQELDKHTRNSKKYYACTQLIKINKLERKIMLEEAILQRQQEKLDERTRRFKISQRTKLQSIDALRDDLESLRQ